MLKRVVEFDFLSDLRYPASESEVQLAVLFSSREYRQDETGLRFIIGGDV